jgi:tetratricopeptide (TPR) repeat protein
METYRNLVENRDDLTIEFINLLNLHSRHQEALDILLKRQFHPWEGAEGRVSWQYEVSLLELAKSCIKKDHFREAQEFLEKARSYPVNLGEGKLPTRVDRPIDFFMGIICEGLGKLDEAKKYFESASNGDYNFDRANYYNDVPVDFVFYQGLALQKLGKDEKAINLFTSMIAFGENHIDDHCRPDYFAVSKPDFSPLREDLDVENKVHCNYLIGLGYLGLKNITKALIFFDQVNELEASHLGAEIHRRMALTDQL